MTLKRPWATRFETGTVDAMSINYYGFPTRDNKLIGPTLEGSGESPRIDSKAVRTALLATAALQGGQIGSLMWQAGGDYVFVDIYDTHVAVTHNTGKGSYQVAVVMDVFDTLRTSGLHVYDPQQGNWVFRDG